MRTRTAIIFSLVFCAVFFVTTCANPHGGLATGWNRFNTYGWPQPWLHVHTMDTGQWINDQRIEGKRSLEGFRINWSPFLISATTAAGIALALVLPYLFWDWKNDHKKRDS